MKSRTAIILQAFLWVVCAFHVVIGVGPKVSPQFPQLVAQYYGAQVNFTPELLYIVKPIGAFMFIVGAMAAAAARDPLRHRAIVFGIVLLFVIRGLQRLVFHEEIGTAVGIAASRNLTNAVVFLLMGAALFLLFRRAAGQAADTV